MALEFINKFNDLGDIVSSKSIAISGEDLPFFPKGTPLLSSLNHDEFLTFPECWNLFEYEIPATGWKTEFQSMTPPK